MLSLIVQFPGERPKASQYTSSSLDDCDLILRGFRGVPYGFALSRSLEAEEFWSRFGQQSATTWENKSSSNYQDEVSQILES